MVKRPGGVEVTVTPSTVVTARLGVHEWYKLAAALVVCVLVPVATGAVFLTRFDNRVQNVERDVEREATVNRQQTELLMRMAETMSRLEERTRR